MQQKSVANKDISVLFLHLCPFGYSCAPSGLKSSLKVVSFKAFRGTIFCKVILITCFLKEDRFETNYFHA